MNTTGTDATKDYFRQDGTVHSWWAPESPCDGHYGHFQEQMRWVVAQTDWAGKSVLDIGTGKGRLAVAYGLKGARVTALDISREMLADARTAASAANVSVPLILGDAERLPLPTATFDVVSCIEAIMHFPHPLAALREIARVVKPGGTVLLSTTNRFRLLALVRWPDRALDRLRHGTPTGPRIFWAHSLWESRRLLAQARLKPEKTHGQGLLQAARIPLGRGRFFPLVPRALADWFFVHVEPRLRETWLLALMGTVMFVCRPVDGRSG